MIPQPADDRHQRRWLVAALLAVVAIAAAAGGCVLAVPQLEPDDYRFLMTIENVAAGRTGWLSASVLENRWDHLWWIAPTDAVRFFRPTLVGSYALDRALFGGTPAAMLATNLVLHVLACWLVVALAFRVMRAPWAAFAASGLYAAFAFHAETMWYVAGRNETLAGLGFCAALLLHDSGNARRRWLALPCYVFALLSKELTIGLPLVCLCWDVQVRGRHARWRDALRGNRWLWLAYAAVAGGVLVLRTIVVPAGSGLVFPYFVAPWHPGFAGHVVAGVRNYVENLTQAQLTLPFLQPDRYGEFTTPHGSLLAFAGLLVLAIALRGERRARWAGLLVLVSWLPTSIVYLSERYLVLPAVGVALAVGLAIARANRRAAWLLAAGLVVWGTHQGSWQFRKNEQISHRARGTTVLRQQLAAHAPALQAAKAVYLLDFPGGTIHAQFAGDQVRHFAGRLDLPVHVLTTFPMRLGRADQVGVTRDGEHTIRLASASPFAVGDTELFAPVPLHSGTIVDRPAAGVVAEVAAGDGTLVTSVRFTLAHPLGDCLLLRWLPPQPFPSGTLPAAIAASGRLVRVRP